MAKPRKFSAQTFSFGLEYIQLSLVRTVWILHLPRKSASFLPLLLPLAKVGVLTPSLTGMHQLEFQENDHHDKLAHVNVWWECCWSVVNIQQQAVKATVELWTLLCSNKISFLLRYRIAWRMQIYRSALNQHYELYLLIKVRLRFCIMLFTRLMSVFILPALRVVMNSFLVQLCGDKWWIEWIFTQNSRKKKKWFDPPHTADILSHVC